MKNTAKTNIFTKLLPFVMAICLSISLPQTVKADEGFSLYTKTPGINLTAGDTADFELYFSGLGNSGEDVSLEIGEMPKGFQGYFKSGIYEVSKVHAASDTDEAPVTFSLSTDENVNKGENSVTLIATTASGLTDTLTITVNISEKKAGTSNFTVEYPDQEGVTGTEFTYSTTLINNSLSAQNYNFSSNAPEGWTVSFSSGDTQISSLDVDAGSSSGVKITVTPPEKVAAGTYPISCSATSAKESLSTDLNVKILGTYGLEISTIDGNLALDAYANKASDVTLILTNSGNVDLENIQLTSNANTDWKVEFDQNKIDSLKAGASQEIKAHITPGSDSITGDYVTGIVASSNNKSASTDLRVTVKTPTGWGIFAILIIAVVVYGLYAVIKKYGRR